MPTIRSRQFEHLQESTLARLRARIPVECPLIVERRGVVDGVRQFGFRVTGPGCEQSGRAQVVTAFIDGYVTCWEHMREERADPAEQRAERYAMEAASLTLRLIEAEKWAATCEKNLRDAQGDIAEEVKESERLREELVKAHLKIEALRDLAERAEDRR